MFSTVMSKDGYKLLSKLTNVDDRNLFHIRHELERDGQVLALLNEEPRLLVAPAEVGLTGSDFWCL